MSVVNSFIVKQKNRVTGQLKYPDFLSFCWEMVIDKYGQNFDTGHL